MRGYAATLVGGTVGFVSVYYYGDNLLGMLYDPWSGVPQAVTCSLAAGIATRLVRAGAALETGLVALSVVWFAFVVWGNNLTGPDVLASMATGLALLGASLLAARWLGVTGHRRRVIHRMRGYEATVVGGLVGSWVGGWLLRVLYSDDDLARWPIDHDCQLSVNFESFTCRHGWDLLVAGILICTFLAAALAAGAATRLVRADAALETGLLAVPLFGLCLVVFWGAFPIPDGRPGWTAVEMVVVLVVLIARWLGVGWHRRRTARASGDA